VNHRAALCISTGINANRHDRQDEIPDQHSASISLSHLSIASVPNRLEFHFNPGPPRHRGCRAPRGGSSNNLLPLLTCPGARPNKGRAADAAEVSALQTLTPEHPPLSWPEDCHGARLRPDREAMGSSDAYINPLWWPAPVPKSAESLARTKDTPSPDQMSISTQTSVFQRLKWTFRL
jgi:hypothetical protein